MSHRASTVVFCSSLSVGGAREQLCRVRTLEALQSGIALAVTLGRLNVKVPQSSRAWRASTGFLRGS